MIAAIQSVVQSGFLVFACIIAVIVVEAAVQLALVRGPHRPPD